MNPSHTIHFLLIDDDDIDVRAVQRALAKRHISNPVTVAHNGQEALDILRGENGQTRIPRPFVILLDLNMPVMSGLEFLNALREDDQLRKSIVFVLTTSDDDRDKTRAYSKQIAGYIVKSEVGRDFMKLVELLDHYMIAIQFPPDHL